LDMDGLKRQIRFNCDVTDARHAGIYSVCGLVMRLRDLYKWERGLPPWQEDESANVLAWIGDKEDYWEGLLDADYRPLSVNGAEVDAFDTTTVNQWLNPRGFFYGAGYAHSLKPTFFLAEIEDHTTIAGREIWILGREHARDLLTLPAFSQNGQAILRIEAGRMYLWDQILYMGNSGRRALDFALQACGLPDQRHETIQRHFDDVWEVQKALYIRHEIGELEEDEFDRTLWRSMLADYPHTAVELFIRTLKDLLADTSPKGVLTHLIENQDSAGLGLYMAFGNGITRMLTKALICAFDDFTLHFQWHRVAEAGHVVREDVKSHSRQVMDIYRQGRRREDLDGARTAIEKVMRHLGLIRQ